MVKAQVVVMFAVVVAAATVYPLRTGGATWGEVAGDLEMVVDEAVEKLVDGGAVYEGFQQTDDINEIMQGTENRICLRKCKGWSGVCVKERCSRQCTTEENAQGGACRRWGWGPAARVTCVCYVKCS